MVEQSTDNLILVVAEREFVVNRKVFTESNPYFRALLEGSFREASENRVELKGISEPDAFAVIVDYVLNKKVNLKDVSKVLQSVLALADMLNDDVFPEFLEKELFRNWLDLENADLILILAETLNVRASLLPHIFKILTNTFIQKGKSLDTKELQKSHDPCSLAIHSSPDLIVQLFETEEAGVFCFSDFDDKNYFYVKGVTAWVFEKELDEACIRKVVRCLGVQCLNEKFLFEYLSKQEESEQKYLLERELKRYIEDTRLVFRNSVLHLCVGWQYQLFELYSFNLQNWIWDLVEFKRFHVGHIASPSTDDEWQLRVIYFYATADSFCSDSRVKDVVDRVTFDSDHGRRKNVYTSAQPRSEEFNTFLIYELNYGETKFSTIFCTEMPGPVSGCHLLRLRDVLHGFVSYTLDGKSFTVSHFCLQRNREDNTWLQSDFRLDPLLTDLPRELTPVAMTRSRRGILVTFRHGVEYIWLAEYNLKSGCLEPLAHIPMPRKHGKKAMMRLGVCPLRVEFDGARKEHNTFNIACCHDTWKPLFHVTSSLGVTEGLVTCPYLKNFDLCTSDSDHVPKLSYLMHLCSSVPPRYACSGL